MGRGLTDRVKAWIESRHVVWGVFVASLAETTVVPVVIEVVLIPVMLANRARLWLIAGSTLAGCLAGATIGYFVGMLAYESVGQPFIEAAGLTEQFELYRSKLQSDGFWQVLVIALTPIPFHIAYLGAGVVKLSFPEFLAAAALGRGVRYFGLAALVAALGRAAGPWVERNKYTLGIWLSVVFLGGYVMWSVLF